MHADQPMVDYQRVSLRVLKTAITQSISAGQLRTCPGAVEVDVVMDHAANALVQRLVLFLAEGQRTESTAEVVVEWPADWWQAFKARWFDCRLLRWVLRRYPVRKAVRRVPQRVELIRVCPHLPIVGDVTRQGHYHVEFLMQDNRF